jgi:hypothetical protein
MRADHIIFFFAIFSLYSCILPTEEIDIEEAKRTVHLDSTYLTSFYELRQQLLKDTASIRKQNDGTTARGNRTNWMSTNSFYLNQIDSSRYTVLMSKLKGRMVDNILINRNGSTIFTIKENVQMNVGDYNETYTHQLVSGDCRCPIKTVFNNVDAVFVDSTINGHWKYTFYKVLTGH